MPIQFPTPPTSNAHSRRSFLGLGTGVAAADRGVRLYRQSISKLQEAVATLNEEDLRFALHLGDFVDEFPESFDAVMPIWETLRMSKYHVLGNHDFQMPRKEVLAGHRRGHQ